MRLVNFRNITLQDLLRLRDIADTEELRALVDSAFKHWGLVGDEYRQERERCAEVLNEHNRRGQK